jgi:anti-sigma factor RsiW
MSDDLELLVQRFLDGELGRSERLDLLKRLDSDPQLRRRVLAGEALLEAAAVLPRPPVPSDFTTRTLERLDPPGTLRLAAWRPRAQVARLLPAAAAACLLLGLGFWAGHARGVRSAASPPAAAASEVLVRLVLVQPEARTVAVAGDFNGWDAAQTPLARGDAGVFRLTLPVKPGRYHYMFVVDGEDWIADPMAPETSFDGFGSHNSVLDVEI